MAWCINRYTKLVVTEDIKVLIGKRVISAETNKEKDLVILNCADGKLFLTWEGSCCAKCYLAHVGGAEDLIESEIIEAENRLWSKNLQGSEFHVVQTMGSQFKTTQGYVFFETRLEHNGYYSGSIHISDQYPVDQYDEPRYKDYEIIETEELEDF